MVDAWALWLLLVGLAVGGVGTWLLMVRPGRDEDDVGIDERRSEAAWISATIERDGGIAPEALVEEVLELHQSYLRTPSATPELTAPPAPAAAAVPPPGSPPASGSVPPGSAPPSGSVPASGSVPPGSAHPGSGPPGSVPPSGSVPPAGSAPPPGSLPPGSVPPPGSLPPPGSPPSPGYVPPPDRRSEAGTTQGR